MGRLDIKIVAARNLPPAPATSSSSARENNNNTSNQNLLVSPNPYVRIIFDPASISNKVARHQHDHQNEHNNNTSNHQNDYYKQLNNADQPDSPMSREPEQIFETTCKTEATFNPNWNEVFKLRIPDAYSYCSSDDHHESNRDNNNTSSLSPSSTMIQVLLQVWHKDIFLKDQLLGQCEMSIGGLVRATVRSESLHLQNGNNWNAELRVKLLALDFGAERRNNNNNDNDEDCDSSVLTLGGHSSISTHSNNARIAGDPFEGAGRRNNDNNQIQNQNNNNPRSPLNNRQKPQSAQTRTTGIRSVVSHGSLQQQQRPASSGRSSRQSDESSGRSPNNHQHQQRPASATSQNNRNNNSGNYNSGNNDQNSSGRQHQNQVPELEQQQLIMHQQASIGSSNSITMNNNNDGNNDLEQNQSPIERQNDFVGASPHSNSNDGENPDQNSQQHQHEHQHKKQSVSSVSSNNNNNNDHHRHHHHSTTTSAHDALFADQQISVRDLVDQKLEARRQKKERDEKMKKQREDERHRLEQERLMLIEYNKEDGNYNNDADHINRNNNARGLVVSKRRSGGGVGAVGKNERNGINSTNNPDDPYFALIKTAMDKEEKRRTASKNHLHASVDRIHGKRNKNNKNNNNSNDRQLAITNNNNSSSASPAASRKNAASSSHSRFASIEEQQQQHNTGKPDFRVSTQKTRYNPHQYQGIASNNNNSSSTNELHDPREIKEAICVCLKAESQRSFLSEQEALALSGGRISYSISQQTTAFGNHHNNNQEDSSSSPTLNESFAYLCVSIARSLIPSVQGNNNNNISHCTMIRKISNLLSNPLWASKLSVSSSNSNNHSHQKSHHQPTSSCLISLLAHGCIELIGSREVQKEQEEDDRTTTTRTIKDKTSEDQQKNDTTNNNDDGQKSNSNSNKNHRKKSENFDLVQWAMIHSAVDSPSLFISLHCPPASDTLLPLGASNDDGLTEDQRTELKNYYLMKKQKDQERENQIVQRRMQSEKEEKEKVGELKERRSKAKSKRRAQFAHQFVNQVFHNIGADDDCEENDNEFDDDEEEEEDLEREELELIGEYDKRHPNGQNDELHDEEYHYAGQFIDQIFNKLLRNNNSNNEEQQEDPSSSSPYFEDEQERGDQQQYQASSSTVARTSGGSYFYYHQNNNNKNSSSSFDQSPSSGSTMRSKSNSPSKSPNRGTSNNNKTNNVSPQQYQALQQTLKQLNLPPAHEHVAIQICLAVEYFLTNEPHGRKIKRISVMCHDSVVELGGHLVMALRERLQARGSSRKVICITTSANLASTAPKRRKKKSTVQKSSYDKDDDEKDDDQEDNDNNNNSSSPPPPPPPPLFSQQSPRDRALSLKALFARLCIPVPKLSFDKEKRRGWRFVVMPDCFAWALTFFAPIAIINYQSMDFPTNNNAENENDDDNDEKKEKQKKKKKNNIDRHNQDTNNNDDAGYITYSHPPTIDDVVSHLWQALANVEGALDSVTGGATLAGFILASTTLMNGLISKGVADSIWNEAFTVMDEMYPSPSTSSPAQQQNTAVDSSPPSKALVAVSSPNGKHNNNNGRDKLLASSPSTNHYQFFSPSFPSPPPVCQCFNGSITPDYFSVRESTFIKRLKTYRHRPSSSTSRTRTEEDKNTTNAAGHHHRKHTSSSSSSTRGALIPPAAIKSYLLKNVAKRPFDSLPAGDDQEWNKNFFTESFHEPHQILSRVSAKFLPPLSSALLLNNNNNGSEGNTNNSSSLKQGDGAAMLTGQKGASVKRMRETFLKEGSKNAAFVRLRLEERIERAQYMENRMQ